MSGTIRRGVLSWCWNTFYNCFSVLICWILFFVLAKYCAYEKNRHPIQRYLSCSVKHSSSTHSPTATEKILEDPAKTTITLEQFLMAQINFVKEGTIPAWTITIASVTRRSEYQAFLCRERSGLLWVVWELALEGSENRNFLHLTVTLFLFWKMINKLMNSFLG